MKLVVTYDTSDDKVRNDFLDYASNFKHLMLTESTYLLIVNNLDSTMRKLEGIFHKEDPVYCIYSDGNGLRCQRIGGNKI